MNDKLITLAIHTSEKARVLKQILTERGIEVFLKEIGDKNGHGISQGFAVRIREADLSRALTIIEENKLFSYNDQQTYRIDDGRKRVLVAVDFSDYSINACRIAFSVAKYRDAKVKILHVYHNIYFPSSLPFADTLKEEEDESLLDKARKEMLALCNDIDQRITDGDLPSVNYSYSLREGNVEEEIEAFIEEYKPTIMILGIKGKDNNKIGALGNVTADIIEMTNIPVLAVPERAQLKDIQSIKHLAFLTNFQKRDLSSFDYLVNVLKPHDSIRITLVHINVGNKRGEKWTETELMGMKQHFEKQYPQLNVEYKLIDSPDMFVAINDYIKEDDVHMICINTRRRNIFGRIFVPSMSRKVLVRTEVALLVLRG